MVSNDDLEFLRRAVDQARAGFDSGNAPFGTILVSDAGEVLFEDHNRTSGGDETLHPEFEVARWAASHVAPERRAGATVYTSGEHCPMCSSAHAWVGLGRIVYAASAQQFGEWREELAVPPAPVAALPIQAIAPNVPVDGPAPELADELRELYQAHLQR